MSVGEAATRASIWLALAAYGVALGLWISGGRGAATRWTWTVGCACFLAHVAFAFGTFHHWSHAQAYRETARQTGELTGFRWGGGIYLNYLLGAVWLWETARWWRNPRAFLETPERYWLAEHGFFLFMIFNGTIVFGHGAIRWAGAILFIALGIVWWRRRAVLT